MWEYKIVAFGVLNISEERLNHFGEQGWELVDVHATSLIFKRKKKNEIVP